MGTVVVTMALNLKAREGQASCPSCNKPWPESLRGRWRNFKRLDDCQTCYAEKLRRYEAAGEHRGREVKAWHKEREEVPKSKVDPMTELFGEGHEKPWWEKEK
uniref:Uncharacterized protein n=2 Tax=viral metagenome TaxID=1070528 RepID=A0A6M3JL94_9ZZZZ